MDTDPSLHLADRRVAAPRYLAPAPHQLTWHQTDLLVIGSGAAGLTAALQAATQADVLLLTRGELLDSNSSWAQGGVAAALAPTDSPTSHLEDTLVAGADLSDRAAVELLVHEAPATMRELAVRGMPFARQNGQFELGLEGGHRHRRVLHAADATGRALTQTLLASVQAHPAIEVRSGYHVVELLGASSDCTGVIARDAQGSWHAILATATILATGGAGALYGLTSNQALALGEGIALAYRAGAAVADLEFVQFHPTVMQTRCGQGFLISEAVRGEGAVLRGARSGERFMPAYDPRAELAPRDVVARGIFAAMRREQTDHVLLDLTHLDAEYITRRFPTITERLRGEDLDPATTPIPVAPAAHYLMGGIVTDTNGATSLAGLYAAGEVTCTGVHGANRLASNSLLECLVFGRRAAAAALSYRAQLSPVLYRQRADRASQDYLTTRLPLQAAPMPTNWYATLAATLREHVGVERDVDGLLQALDTLDRFPIRAPALANSDTISAVNAALVARLLITGALLREESRGAHTRRDFPQTNPRWRAHLVQQHARMPTLVAAVANVIDTTHAQPLAIGG